MKQKLNILEYFPRFYNLANPSGKDEIEIFPIDKEIWPNLFEASVNGVYIKEDNVEHRHISHLLEKQVVDRFDINPKEEMRRVIRNEYSTEMTWEVDGQMFDITFSYDKSGKVLKETFNN